MNIYIPKPTTDLSAVTTVYDQAAFLEQRNTYSFTPAISGRYYFGLSDTMSGIGYRMMMWDSSGYSVFDTYSKSYAANLDASETHEFQIRQDSGIGSYTLSIGMQKEAVDISANTIIYDATQFSEQWLKHYFAALMTGRYNFEMPETMNGVGFRMMLWDKYANNIIDTYSKLFSVSLDAGETYEFQIRQDSGLGSFKLSIGKQKPQWIFPSAMSLMIQSLSQIKEISIIPPRFSGEFTFSLSSHNSSCSFRLMAWDNYEYNIMDTCWDSYSVSLTDGTQYEVQVWQDSGMGAYSLTVSRSD